MAETVLPGLRRALGEAPGRHAKRQPIEAPLIYKREYLQEIDVFRDLSADEMTWLAESTRMVTIPAGQMIYHQHDAGRVSCCSSRAGSAFRA